MSNGNLGENGAGRPSDAELAQQDEHYRTLEAGVIEAGIGFAEDTERAADEAAESADLANRVQRILGQGAISSEDINTFVHNGVDRLAHARVRHAVGVETLRRPIIRPGTERFGLDGNRQYQSYSFYTSTMSTPELRVSTDKLAMAAPIANRLRATLIWLHREPAEVVTRGFANVSGRDAQSNWGSYSRDGGFLVPHYLVGENRATTDTGSRKDTSEILLAPAVVDHEVHLSFKGNQDHEFAKERIERANFSATDIASLVKAELPTRALAKLMAAQDEAFAKEPTDGWLDSVLIGSGSEVRLTQATNGILVAVERKPQSVVSEGLGKIFRRSKEGDLVIARYQRSPLRLQNVTNIDRVSPSDFDHLNVERNIYRQLSMQGLVS